MSLGFTSYNKYLLLTLFVLAASLLSTNIKAEDEPAPTPVYVELLPDFIVNYGEPAARLKYIKTKINLRTDSNHEGLIILNMPLVRDTLVMFLSTRTPEQVSGAIAREQTRKDAAVAINEVLKEETGQEPVIDVLFASFVTQ
ncbi:flagellar basal body-associated FliL family protein [Marinomonas dokdonensis]|uniref:flagellar basal body-associated FliL family protein n=1 Tax=Marinomonas dokdonensis TaxID=328224 RepID=UPI00405571D7